MENSIVRNNLMDDVNYRPYCGSNVPRNTIGGCDNPRVVWKAELNQFKCPKCGMVSEFPADFINRYKEKHNL